MAADRRTQILEAAIDAFCEQGLDGAGMDDIAQRAGVAKGTLYLYFTNKDDLIRQAYWLCHQQDVEACQAGLDAIEGAIPKLQRRLRNVSAWGLANPKKIRMEMLYKSSPKYSKGRRYQTQTLQYQTIDKIMRDGLERGELRRLPAPLLGETFFGIGAAVFYYLCENPEKLDDEDFWHTCDEMIAGCLRQPP